MSFIFAIVSLAVMSIETIDLLIFLNVVQPIGASHAPRAQTSFSLAPFDLQHRHFQFLHLLLI